MATTNLGRVRFNMRGDFNPNADPLYSLLDLVSDGGGSFAYINDTPSNEPTSSTSHWQQIASQGTKGDAGGTWTKGEDIPLQSGGTVGGKLTEIANDFDEAVGAVTVDSEVVLARGGKTILGDRLDEVDSQLADNMQQTNVVNKNLWTTTRGNYKARPMVSFTDDDGRSEVITDLAPIFTAKNVPLTVALYNSSQLLTNDTYKAELKELQDNHNWEIVSHAAGHNHLKDLTEAELRVNFEGSLSTLRANGFNVESLFYPYGEHNELVRTVAAEYFRSGVVATGVEKVGNKFDTPDIFRILRVAFAYTGLETLEEYKTIVDNAVANNEWLIFIHHIWMPEFNENQKIILGQLIDYIKSLNVDIVNIRDGLNYYAPMITTGIPNSYTSYFNLFKSGKVTSNHAIDYKSMNTHPATDGRDKFENPITVYNINSVDGGNVGYPGSGIVVMFKGQMVEFDFQLHIHYTTGAVSTRKTQNDGSWGSWVVGINKTNLETEQFVIRKGLNSYTSEQPITDYTSPKITVFDVNTSGSTGFPGAGTSIVYRTPQGNGWNRNEFRKYMTNETYSRYVDSTGAWTPWVKTSVV